jgi:hypothetical protein
MSQKVTHYRRRNRKRHFLFTLESTQKNYSKSDEEEEGRKGKVAAKVAVI